MLVNGSAMEQAMPATGLVGHGGLGPGNISPGSIGPGSLSPGALGPGSMMGQGIPPHYNGSYHPSYMQQSIQVCKITKNITSFNSNFWKHVLKTLQLYPCQQPFYLKSKPCFMVFQTF
jgi:hypothetical protein